MKLPNVLFNFLLVLIVAGCAASPPPVHSIYSFSPEDRFTIRVENSAPVDTKVLRAFTRQLDAGVSALAVDEIDPTRTVTIELTNFRPRHPAALHSRLNGGFNTLTSVTTIQDTQSGSILGRVEHTTNDRVAGIGLGGSVIKTHTDYIANYLLTGQVR